MVIRLSRPVECYNTAISKRWSLFRWRHQNEKLAVARNNISNIPSKTRLAFPPYIFYTSKYILYIIYNIIYIYKCGLWRAPARHVLAKFRYIPISSTRLTALLSLDRHPSKELPKLKLAR